MSVAAAATEVQVGNSINWASSRLVDLPLTVILALAGLLRFGILLIRSQGSGSTWIKGDSAGYLTLSRDLDAFVSKSNVHFSLSLLRTPVYPLFLAVARTITGSSIIGPMIFQVLLGVGVVYVTYRLGLSLYGRRVALYGAAILAVDPLSIVYSSTVLTEVLFTFFLVCSALLLWRPSANRWPRALASGLLLGVATLTRPVSLYLSILLAIGYLIIERKRLRQAVVVVLSFLIGFSLIAGGWIVRNEVVGGVATISTIEAYNVLYYRAEGALAEDEHLPLSKARSEVSNQLRARLPRHPTPGQVDRAEESLGKTIILNNPVGYAKEVAKGGGRLVLGPGGDALVEATAGHAKDVVDGYGDLYLAILYVLVVVGLLSAWREHRLRSCLLPLLIIAYLAIVSSGLEAYSRFRVPIMPFLALIAGAGATVIVRHIFGVMGSRVCDRDR